MTKYLDGGEDEEEETDNMFALMEQIKRCKDDNKGLNDEDRRINAELIMQKLANMMDLGSDNEEGRDYGDEQI